MGRYGRLVTTRAGNSDVPRLHCLTDNGRLIRFRPQFPQYTAALKSDGTVWAVGKPGIYENHAYSFRPLLQVAGLRNVVAISAGDIELSALLADGTIAIAFSPLSDGSSNWTSPTPIVADLPGAKDAVEIASIDFREKSFVARADGSVWQLTSQPYALPKKLVTKVEGVPTVMASSATDEYMIRMLINADRASKGLPALNARAELVHSARKWSTSLADTAVLGQACAANSNPALASTISASFFQASDVVVCGGIDPVAMFAALKATPQYQASIANPNVDSVGVGVAYSGETMYVTTGFMNVDERQDAWFADVAPARLFDSRSGSAIIDGVGSGGGIRSAGQISEITVSNRATVPSLVSAVALNVTAVNPSDAGYVSVFPCGSPPPNASNLNFVRGQTIANFVLAKPDADGKVCVLTSSATHLLVDLAGFFPLSSTYSAITPARLYDTRLGSSTIDGIGAGSGATVVGSVTRVKISGRAGSAIDTPVAVALNVTVPATNDGYLTVFPCDTPKPNASSLNYSAGKTIAAAAIVKVGVSGEVCVFSSSSTHLIVDINGRLETDDRYVPVNPARLVDTRPGSSTIDAVMAGIGQRPANATTELKVGGRATVPATTTSAIINVTVTQPVGDGYITVWPCGTPKPNTSSLNYTAGQTIANTVISKIGTGGKVCIATSTAAHLIADLNGYQN
jgi:uncharacterized protein YkwD